MGSKHLHQAFSLENQSKVCWNTLGSSQHKDLLWKEVCTQGCFPFPLWIVPSLSQLERGHLELKRPIDTCVKCILPLPDGNNWSLEEALTGCGVSGSEWVAPADRAAQTHSQQSHCQKWHCCWGTRDLLPAVDIGWGNEISFLHKLGHTSILKWNAEKKGFPPWFLVSIWGVLFSFSPLSCG